MALLEHSHTKKSKDKGMSSLSAKDGTVTFIPVLNEVNSFGKQPEYEMSQDIMFK